MHGKRFSPGGLVLTDVGDQTFMCLHFVEGIAHTDSGVRVGPEKESPAVLFRVLLAVIEDAGLCSHNAAL